MSRKESKKNKLNDFHKAQLENHKEIFASVEPITTQDGKDQGHQNDIKTKEESKIRRALSKLFRVSHKRNKKVVANNGSKLDQNNNLEIYDAIEAKIKQMSSKEVLQFLNRDEIQPSEMSDKGNVKVNSVNIEDQIKNIDSKQILEFFNKDNIANKKIVGANEATTKGKVTVENKSALSWVSTITQNKSNQNRGR